MQIQRGLKPDSVHTKFVLGAHPIIEHFIETRRIRDIFGTYMRADKRMKLDDDKVLALLHGKNKDHRPDFDKWLV